MAEYIDREAALKAIAEDKIEMTPELIAIGRAIGTYTAEQAFDGINQACDRHIDSIKIIPAEDVQPVKHGSWDFVIPEDVSERDSYRCSECHEFALFDNWCDYVKSKYCPHCGAVMDGIGKKYWEEYDGELVPYEDDET